MSNNKPIIAAIIELIGDYFGLLGLGWIYGGDFMRGPNLQLTLIRRGC
jgi:hypothetical protein